MSRTAENVAYWREHESRYPHQCVRQIGGPRPDVWDRIVEEDFLCVPIDGLAFWGFSSPAARDFFEAEHPLGQDDRSTLFDPRTPGFAVQQAELFAALG